MRNLILSAVLAGTSLFGLTAQAADAPLNLEAGKQYVELGSAVAISKPGKIEVVELFWYGCPHCFHFEPTINPWIKQLPEDVNFVRLPAMFGGVWDIHGQAFIALETMQVEGKVHQAIFKAIQEDGKKLATPEELADFLATQGIDRDIFLSTYNSFGVKGQVANAKRLAMAYQVTGVPSMVVNGKYRFDIGSSGGPEQALQVADQLIARERAAK
jgi:thiol:disulfide interchange protein DsbA